MKVNKLVLGSRVANPATYVNGHFETIDKFEKALNFCLFETLHVIFVSLVLV